MIIPKAWNSLLEFIIMLRRNLRIVSLYNLTLIGKNSKEHEPDQFLENFLDGVFRICQEVWQIMRSFIKNSCELTFLDTKSSQTILKNSFLIIFGKSHRETAMLHRLCTSFSFEQCWMLYKEAITNTIIIVTVMPLFYLLLIHLPGNRYYMNLNDFHVSQNVIHSFGRAATQIKNVSHV